MDLGKKEDLYYVICCYIGKVFCQKNKDYRI